MTTRKMKEGYLDHCGTKGVGVAITHEPSVGIFLSQISVRDIATIVEGNCKVSDSQCWEDFIVICDGKQNLFGVH